jgi:hypothetical protein
VDTIDRSFAQLQTAVGQSLQALQTLGAKLQTAADAGDAQAREWGLDLREIALGLREEQQQVVGLLEALHQFVVANAHQPVSTAPVMPAAAPAPMVALAPQGGGGLLSRFLGGSFGQAMVSGAGLGVGIGAGETLINDIFN